MVSKVRLGYVSPWLFTNHPMGIPEPPDGYTWSLPFLYLGWAIAIALLYFAGRSQESKRVAMTFRSNTYRSSRDLCLCGN